MLMKRACKLSLGIQTSQVIYILQMIGDFQNVGYPYVLTIISVLTPPPPKKKGTLILVHSVYLPGVGSMFRRRAPGLVPPHRTKC